MGGAEGTGKLTASSNGYGAGIGGDGLSFFRKMPFLMLLLLSEAKTFQLMFLPLKPMLY
jgi:hypothetical protein